MGRDGRWREDGNDGGWREEKYGLRGRSGKRGEEDSVDEGKGGAQGSVFYPPPVTGIPGKEYLRV